MINESPLQRNALNSSGRRIISPIITPAALKSPITKAPPASSRILRPQSTHSAVSQPPPPPSHAAASSALQRRSIAEPRMFSDSKNPEPIITNSVLNNLDRHLKSALTSKVTTHQELFMNSLVTSSSFSSSNLLAYT